MSLRPSVGLVCLSLLGLAGPAYATHPDPEMAEAIAKCAARASQAGCEDIARQLSESGVFAFEQSTGQWKRAASAGEVAIIGALLIDSFNATIGALRVDVRERIAALERELAASNGRIDALEDYVQSNEVVLLDIKDGIAQYQDGAADQQCMQVFRSVDEGSGASGVVCSSKDAAVAKGHPWYFEHGGIEEGDSWESRGARLAVPIWNVNGVRADFDLVVNGGPDDEEAGDVVVGASELYPMLPGRAGGLASPGVSTGSQIAELRKGLVGLWDFDDAVAQDLSSLRADVDFYTIELEALEINYGYRLADAEDGIANLDIAVEKLDQAHRSLGGTVTSMAQSIQYAADQLKAHSGRLDDIEKAARERDVEFYGFASDVEDEFDAFDVQLSSAAYVFPVGFDDQIQKASYGAVTLADATRHPKAEFTVAFEKIDPVAVINGTDPIDVACVPVMHAGAQYSATDASGVKVPVKACISPKYDNPFILGETNAKGVIVLSIFDVAYLQTGVQTRLTAFKP